MIQTTQLADAAPVTELAHAEQVLTDQTYSDSQSSQMPSISTEAYVRGFYSKNRILAEVARCESRFHQFTKSGNVVRGEMVYEDVGIMQINETYHKQEAEKLGFNIYTLSGNLGFAQWLYDHEGTQPWSASEGCWRR